MPATFLQVGQVKAMKKVAVVLLALVCSCSAIEQRMNDQLAHDFLNRRVPEFKLGYDFDSPQGRINLTLETVSEPLCLPVEQWPSLRGTLDSGESSAEIVDGSNRFPAKSDHFSDCWGGCGYLKVERGKPLTGMVTLDQFPGVELYRLSPEAKFQLELNPFVCSNDMRISRPIN